jgi:hypothetical protein
MLAHGLLVEIHARLSLPQEHALCLEGEEVLPRLLVDLRVIGVYVQWQVDLCPVHVQEVKRLVMG